MMQRGRENGVDDFHDLKKFYYRRRIKFGYQECVLRVALIVKHFPI